MGLLSKVTAGATPQKEPGDDVLLLHGLMLMAGSDGVIEGAEWATLEAFWNTLPEFRGKEFQEVIGEAEKIIGRFGGLKESVKAISDIKSEAVRKKLFVLAADLAMSSGDVDQNEDELLETMQRLLNIGADEATKILEVLSLKYMQ